MPGSYIPAKLSLFDIWSQNFSSAISADPTAYNLTAPDAAAIAAVVGDFHTKYGISTDPTTRSPVTVADTHASWLTALSVCRQYASFIGSSPGVANADKSAAGLTIRATTRTPIPAPLTYPILGMVAQQPLTALVKYADSATPTTKAKPYGAIQVELALSVQATPVTDPNAAPIIGVQTKSPMSLDLSAYAPGTPARLWARWQTRRGLVGPWSVALSFVIA